MNSKTALLQIIFVITICGCSGSKYAVGQELTLSSYRGDLSKLIAAAQEQNAVAVIDRNLTINSTITIEGDINLRGKGNVTIHNAVEGKTNYMFWLGNGHHQFSNLSITQHANGLAFQTTITSGAVWKNTFDSVHILSGRSAYESSRGGNAGNWCITTWRNSIIRVAAVAISIFSQDGPYKALHLQHMDIANGKGFGNNQIEGYSPDYVTHTLYCHPNVSLNFDDVVLDAGSLSLHHFSGGGVPGQNQYLKLHKVMVVNGSFEMVTPEKEPIIITESSLGPYTTMGVKHPRVDAKNTEFKNTGNGIMLRGKLVNCTGGAWTSSYGPLEIVDCRLDELSFRDGGTATVRNSKIAYVQAGDRDKRFEGRFFKCEIGVLQASKAIGKFHIDKESTVRSKQLPDDVLVQ